MQYFATNLHLTYIGVDKQYGQVECVIDYRGGIEVQNREIRGSREKKNYSRARESRYY